VTVLQKCCTASGCHVRGVALGFDTFGAGWFPLLFLIFRREPQINIA